MALSSVLAEMRAGTCLQARPEPAGEQADPLAAWMAGARAMSAADLLALRAVLVVAPHPDDESLGCGGLIARLTGAGVPVRIVVVSDGSQSHPRSRRFDAAARRALRHGELLDAAGQLGVPAPRVAALRLPDGAVPGPGQHGFALAAARLQAIAQDMQARAIVAPWRRDPHPDHRASHALADAAASGLSQCTGKAVRLLEYFVWTSERAAPAELPQPGEGQAWRLDIACVVAAKARAIAAHRSQCGGVIDDDPGGFTIPQAMRQRALLPAECFFEAA